MSDVMLCGILRMPFDDGGDMHLMQLKQACREAATELECRADALTALQTAALKVVEETDRIHDNEPWPVKYRAPYGAIVELRALLAKYLGARTISAEIENVRRALAMQEAGYEWKPSPHDVGELLFAYDHLRNRLEVSEAANKAKTEKLVELGVMQV